MAIGDVHRGSRVRIVAVASRPGLNGQVGTVRRVLADKNRCEVVLDTGEQYALRRDAIELLPSEAMAHALLERYPTEPDCDKVLTKRTAARLLNELAQHGWERTVTMANVMLEPVSPILCHAKTALPGDIVAAWQARGLSGAKGSHVWALGILAALLETVAAVRGRREWLDGIELTPHGLQRLYERTWENGVGDSSYFGGRLVGKSGSEAHTGPADMCEVLSFVGIDAALIDIYPDLRADGEQGDKAPSVSSGKGCMDDAPRRATLAALLTAARTSGMPLILQESGGSAQPPTARTSTAISSISAQRLRVAPSARRRSQRLPPSRRVQARRASCSA